MLLRLHELPPQYAIGDDSGCGLFGTEGATPTVAEYVIEHRPNGCQFDYERLFPLPGGRDDPPVVSSLAVPMRSERSAEEGFAIAADLLGYTTGNEYAEKPGKATVGDASRRFHTDDALVFGKIGRPGSALVWRSGKTLAAIYVAGVPHAAGDRIALRLARVQQRHVSHPTPYTEAQQDWTMVPLENPGIEFPVWWLGRTFKPGHGLPPSPLREAWLPLGAGGGPDGMKGLLHYDWISLAIFTRASWRKWESSPFGDLVRAWRCTEATEIALPKGRATIYAGYTKDFATCPDRRPDVFLAEVHLGHTVVGIDLPYCIVGGCIEAFRGPYHSVDELEAVARGLRLRKRPGA